MVSWVEAARSVIRRRRKEILLFHNTRFNRKERHFLITLLRRVDDTKNNTFPHIEFLALLVGGTVTGIHKKPPEERDLDIVINFSAETGSRERLSLICEIEQCITQVLCAAGLAYVQHSGTLGPVSNGFENYKGWALIELEFEGKKHPVMSLLDGVPELRFVTTKPRGARPFDIIIPGLDYLDMDTQLELLVNEGKAFEILYDSRK
ncbi:MAG: hypothetical protein HYU80_03385 [Candidatus Blackburnbacteria bacterium]|nr:hypothetical protein [Candidatus Blackburnbacteria bacterium]